jgi:hypothetical protein
MTFDRDPDEELILNINRVQELTMELRQNAVDKQRVLSAILKSKEFEGEDYERLRIVIKDIKGVQHVIPLDKIRSKKKQKKSLMPEPLTAGMTEQNLADITAFLMSVK